MNITLWVVQVVLALLFLMAGFTKTFRPLETVAKSLPWVKEYPAWFTRFIGVSELLGAIGLILPGLVHILPWLTVVAAIGLAIVMVAALIFHLIRREYTGLIAPLVLLVLTLFVAYGRWVLAPL